MNCWISSQLLAAPMKINAIHHNRSISLKTNCRLKYRKGQRHRERQRVREMQREGDELCRVALEVSE